MGYYGDGATGLWPTQVKDPLWSFMERLERDLKAAREYAERLERERDDANERARLAVVRADIVQRERDEARAQLRIVPYLDRVADLEQLLRDLEWGTTGYCPCCGAPRHRTYSHQLDGHAPDCRLKAALEGRDG